MKRLGLPLYIGFIMYALSSAALGPANPASVERLESERARIRANLDELERLNASLARRAESLATDPETQALEARSLGYIRPGEKVLRIPALPSRARSAMAGRILGLREAGLPGRFLPLPLGALAFAACLAALGAGRRIEPNGHKQERP